MNTIIEKIRAEVERQREEIRPTDTGEMKVVGTPTQLEQGWLNALSWMEKVLDTLQEQPVKTNIVEDLKHYLATTPKEQIEKDWESLKEWGKVSPSVSEFLGWEQPVYDVTYIKRLHEKRILPTLKGEIKHKFRNEYNTILQTLGLIPLLNPYDVARKRLEEMCLAFASWGFYNLHLERCEHYPDDPVFEGLGEEINRWMGSTDCFPEGVGISPLPKAMEIVERTARHFYELGCRRTAEKYDEIEYKRQRADVCEGLEEEIQKYMSKRWEFGCINPTTPVYLYDFTTDELKECARHFAQWGAEHLKK